jgi:hypothetical protein
MFDPKTVAAGLRAAALGGGLLLLVGCGGGGGGGGGGPPVVVVSWTANHEAAVNRSGGGYRLYYSTAPGFALDSATLVDLPYAAGPTAPTSTTLTLDPGVYYFKVVAYSSLNTTGSAPSAEVQVVVP